MTGSEICARRREPERRHPRRFAAQVQQVLWETTREALKAAANAVSKDADGLNSDQCQKDLNGISMRGSGDTSVAGITAAAGNAKFESGYAPSNQGVSLNGTSYNSPAALFNANPNAFAFTQMAQSSPQYWLFSSLVFLTTSLPPISRRPALWRVGCCMRSFIRWGSLIPNFKRVGFSCR